MSKSKPAVMVPSRAQPPRPPARPFTHEAKCRTRDAAPEWIEERRGAWSRTCSCTVQWWYAPNVPPPGAEPDPARHSHHPPDCPATAVVKENVDGGRYTYCWACQTYTHTVDLSGMDPQSRDEYLAGLVI